MRRLITILAVVTSVSDVDGLESFTRAVERYVALRTALETTLGRPEAGDTYEQWLASAAALRSALQAARQSAVEGDIFTSDVSDAFRARIHEAFANSNADMIEFVEELLSDARDSVTPQVNERFPWAAGNGMLPTVLAILPQLPPDLQYRFVGPDLVLIDLRPDLVIDILREALPSPTLWYHRRAACSLGRVHSVSLGSYCGLPLGIGVLAVKANFVVPSTPPGTYYLRLRAINAWGISVTSTRRETFAPRRSGSG